MAPTDDPLAIDMSENALELLTQQIILASANHDLTTLRMLLRDSSTAAPANVKDPDTGHTPLHAAIAGAAEDEAEKQSNGAIEDDGEDSEAQSPALQTVQLLLQNGAIWNALDTKDETPGCLAWRLGLKLLYNAVVEAGVRTELLFQRLDGYEPLGDEDSDGSDDEEGEDGAGAESAGAPSDNAAASDEVDEPKDADQSLENANYLASKLTFTSTRLLDDASNAVMMEWEKDIMARSVDALMPTSSEDELTVLNIGHGMGIVDTLFQSHSPRPTSHHIVEAHAAVASQARAPDGFLTKHPQGVTLHEGRWQDVLPQLAAQGLQFDAIYFDTFAESYGAFRTFFEEYVIMLLKEGGRWSFFHGLGADRRVCYDVYTKVVEMDLFEAGFEVEWARVRVPEREMAVQGEWDGVRRRYWELDEYRLPVCTFLG